MAELLGQLGVEEIAALHKGSKGVVVEDGGPGVAVVSGIVTRGEDMLEVGALVAADNLRYEAYGVQMHSLELVGVDGLLHGDAVVVHVEERGG